VRAGIVTDIGILDRYEWSGHSRLLGKRTSDWQSVDDVLVLFAQRLGQARRAYRAFVLDGWTQGHRNDLTGGGLRRSRAGWEMCQRVGRGRERWASDERILGSSEFVRCVLGDLEEHPISHSPPGENPAKRIDRLVSRVAILWKVPADTVRSGCKERCVVAARAVVSYAAVVGLRMRLTDVARALEVGPSSVLRGVHRGAGDLEESGLRMADLLE
jgi:hypothetical protein